MADNASKDGLPAVLAELETSLLTPVVPGELPAWVNGVRTAWAEASDTLSSQLSRQHPRQYAQITAEDPALASRIEQMKSEDEAIASTWAGLNSIIDWLTEHASDFEPDEAKLKQHIALLTKEGNELIQRVKKQHLAVVTWFHEAFNRDRGVAD